MLDTSVDFLNNLHSMVLITVLEMSKRVSRSRINTWYELGQPRIGLTPQDSHASQLNMLRASPAPFSLPRFPLLGVPASLKAPGRRVIQPCKKLPRAMDTVSTESVVKSTASTASPSQADTTQNSKTVLMTSPVAWLPTATPRAASQGPRQMKMCTPSRHPATLCAGSLETS